MHQRVLFLASFCITAAILIRNCVVLLSPISLHLLLASRVPGFLRPQSTRFHSIVIRSTVFPKKVLRKYFTLSRSALFSFCGFSTPVITRCACRFGWRRKKSSRRPALRCLSTCFSNSQRNRIHRVFG